MENIFLFLDEGTEAQKRLSGLPKVSQLVSGGAEI